MRRGGQILQRSTGPAAYAAAAARTGTLDAAWPEILQAYDKAGWTWPDRCKVARSEDDACPAGQLIEYPDYPAALRAYLEELGYTPPA